MEGDPFSVREWYRTVREGLDVEKRGKVWGNKESGIKEEKKRVR